MQTLQGFWQFLNTDVQEIPWGELAEKGIEAVTASRDFAADFGEHAPNIKQLQPYFQQVEPFLKTLDSPVTQLAISGLPFVSIGIGLLRMYLDSAKIEPTYESSVIIAAQLAYLQSLEVVLSKISDKATTKLKHVSLKALLEKQLARLDSVELSLAEAKIVTSRFRESVLATQFGNALAEQLQQQAGFNPTETHRLVEQVAWATYRYLHQAIAEAGDSVEPLAEAYRTGGQQVQDRYDSIDVYLNEVIAPLPEEQVFDERNPLIRFQDIYVPLEVQPLTQAGEKQIGVKPVNSHIWAQELLERPDEPRKVMFVEGEAGRGKSVFCRMFADLVRREMTFSYVPLLIRLRHIRTLANNLTETLEDCPDLEQVRFIRGDADWLADRNTRFLIILDGFDELLLEGRATGGLKEFLQQVADFQARSHHQCLVTGRPLALQGVDRLITQTKNLERVRIEPMSDPLRELWLANWQTIFGEAEVIQFRDFIQACPKEIANTLAREPLLIYLLARLHREGHLTRKMFADTTNRLDQRIQAKLRIYRESVNWVLEKQRQDENLRLAGLEDLEDLREVLREAALCVVQSGNETARLTMFKDRFQDTANPIANLLKQSQQATGQSDDKALNNLLTTFYLKPGEGDKRGSVEFAHKSFGEYLFAERLKVAFEAWTELDRRGKRPILDDRTVNGQIYDLLGYGGLSEEIVEYLFELLQQSDLNRVMLFERLHEFYWRWYEGDFLNQPPTENLPQKKMLQLKAQEISIELKQVDVLAGNTPDRFRRL
ncbi:MAG: NACHT domain-containing protein [Cyanothece sp. SIO1E1]|nr:NACHT domain-containing protein [Cyanothece sp. SIO1E1]